MADDRKNYAGTDPETQRQEISRRGYAPHPADEPPRGLGTTTRIAPGGDPGKREGESKPKAGTAAKKKRGRSPA